MTDGKESSNTPKGLDKGLKVIKGSDEPPTGLGDYESGLTFVEAEEAKRAAKEAEVKRITTALKIREGLILDPNSPDPDKHKGNNIQELITEKKRTPPRRPNLLQLIGRKALPFGLGVVVGASGHAAIDYFNSDIPPSPDNPKRAEAKQLSNTSYVDIMPGETALDNETLQKIADKYGKRIQTVTHDFARTNDLRDKAGRYSAGYLNPGTYIAPAYDEDGNFVMPLKAETAESE